MNLLSEVTLSVVTTNERQSADGRNTYYSLAIMQNNEVGTLSCSKDVYDAVRANFAPLKPYAFQLAYNDTYKSMRVTAVKNISDGKLSDKPPMK